MNLLAHTRIRAHRAFTLVEMIVSLAVFTIVAVVALTAVLKVIDANKKAQTLQSSLTNLNYGLDTMSRELRVGSRYYCDVPESTTNAYEGSWLTSHTSNACPLTQVQAINSDGSAAVLAFISSDPAKDSNGNTCINPNGSNGYRFAHAYRFVNTGGTIHLQRAVQTQCGTSIQDGDFLDIVSSDVTITGFSLKVTYDSSGNSSVHPIPYALIGVTGYVGIKEKEKTYFSTQTAASPITK